MKNLLVAQSGGPTAVINSSLAGVIKGGFDRLGKIGRVYGSLNGIDGILSESFVDLERFREERLMQLLRQTPSSYLGSCRKKLPKIEENEEIYESIVRVLERYDIGYFLYIGGNDSMDTVDKLSRYIRIKGIDIKAVGIPKTIDNDLALTDHTPGYGSAAKLVANAMRQLRMDTAVYNMPSVIVLEIMGRNAGWLTAAAALANDSHIKAADIICLPEHPFEADAFLARTEEAAKEQKTVMIAVSEGLKDKNGNYIAADSQSLTARTDSFAHAALGGAGRYLEGMISGGLGLKTRTIELSTLQRCWASGASLCDVDEAFRVGYEGVKLAVDDGMSGIMPAFKRVSDAPYAIEIEAADVSRVANFEKRVPKEMITADGFGVNEEFIKYASPLIKGEPELIYKDGLLQLTLL